MMLTGDARERSSRLVHKPRGSDRPFAKARTEERTFVPELALYK